jgi:hypothetical protein
MAMMTTREAAEYLGMKPNTLEIWRGKGTGPHFYKYDGPVRYAKEDLDAWLDERKRRNTSQYPTHQVAPCRLPDAPLRRTQWLASPDAAKTATA